MGQKIPKLIKILREWLRGVSRDAIAINNQIGYGSVSKIIKAIKDKEIPDIDLLREIALTLKRQNLDVVDFASSMRLRNILNSLDLSEERVERFLEHLSIFFYKSDDRNVEKFLIQLELVHKIAINLDVSIFDMPEKIKKLEAEVTNLEHEKSILEQIHDQKSKEINFIVKQLNELGFFLRRRSDGVNPLEDRYN